MYSIDFLVQVRRLLPPFLRGAKTTAWLRSLLEPLSQLQNLSSNVHPVRYPECPPLPVPSVSAFRRHTLLRMTFNGQTLCLERLLNLYYYSYFDPAEDVGNAGYRIWIEDEISDVPIIPLFLDYENQPLWLFENGEIPSAPPPPPNGGAGLEGPQYIYTNAEYLGENDFIVWVPVSLVFDETELRTLVDSYKMAGARYMVQTY